MQLFVQSLSESLIKPVWFLCLAGVGATRRSRKARLGSVSDYCLHHCECPVIVVRFPEDKNGETIVHRSNSRPRTPSPHASPSPSPKVPAPAVQKLEGVDEVSV